MGAHRSCRMWASSNDRVSRSCSCGGPRFAPAFDPRFVRRGSMMGASARARHGAGLNASWGEACWVDFCTAPRSLARKCEIIWGFLDLAMACVHTECSDCLRSDRHLRKAHADWIDLRSGGRTGDVSRETTCRSLLAPVNDGAREAPAQAELAPKQHATACSGCASASLPISFARERLRRAQRDSFEPRQVAGSFAPKHWVL